MMERSCFGVSLPAAGAGAAICAAVGRGRGTPFWKVREGSFPAFFDDEGGTGNGMGLKARLITAAVWNKQMGLKSALQFGSFHIGGKFAKTYVIHVKYDCCEFLTCAIECIISVKHEEI